MRKSAWPRPKNSTRREKCSRSHRATRWRKELPALSIRVGRRSANRRSRDLVSPSQTKARHGRGRRVSAGSVSYTKTVRAPLDGPPASRPGRVAIGTRGHRRPGFVHTADGVHDRGDLGASSATVRAIASTSRFEGHRGSRAGRLWIATSLEALPHEKLGVVVITSKNAANAVTTRIADAALKGMLAARQQKPVPEPEVTSPVDPQLARRIAGRYVSGDHGVDLIESGGKLSLLPINGGLQVSVRSVGDELIVDSPLSYGEKILVRGDDIVSAGVTLKTVSARSLIRHQPHGRDSLASTGPRLQHSLTSRRRQEALGIGDWFEFDPLDKVSANVFKFARGRSLASGSSSRVTRPTSYWSTVANVLFPRRKVGTGRRCVTTTHHSAADRWRGPAPGSDCCRASERDRRLPPRQTSWSSPLSTRQSNSKFVIATTNNFLGTVFTRKRVRSCRRPAAEALVRAHRKLRTLGTGC